MRAAKLVVITAMTAALVSCGSSSGNSGQTDDDAEAADRGTMGSLALQTIGYPDLERHDLFGPSCAFAADNGLAPVFLGMEKTGHIKMGDQLLTLTAEPGSDRNAAGFPINYSGLSFTAVLELEGQGRGFGDGGGLTYSSGLTVTDTKGRMIYKETGSAQCGA